MPIKKNTKPVLLRKIEGTALCARTYRYGDYYIKICYDGVDVISSVEPVVLASPVLRREKSGTFLEFPMGMYTGSLDQLIRTLKDLQFIETKLEELSPWKQEENVEQSKE